MNTAGDILIVDDHPNNLTVLGGILDEEGYVVRPALSGELALRAVDAVTPDLILLDVRMPGMDGYETCRRLKANPATQAIPVIFISALHETEDKLLAFQAGAVDYITKPFQGEEVLARVSTQMGLANARKGLAEKNAQLSALMEQLVQSEKLKSLGSLAAGVAHELNTPVGNALLAADSINTYAKEFVQRQPGASSSEMAELLEACVAGTDLIVRNLNRASRLIRSLKEVSIDRASERRRQIKLAETVSDVVTLMGGVLRKAPFPVHVDIDPQLSLETYPGHLEQILCNLIENAIVHGFEGATTGEIRIAAQAAAQGVVLTVSDNGRGIPEENLTRIFDPFFTTRLGQGGSGLGLHIAYSLTTGMLGGSLQVASTPGAGTTFTLALPRVAPVGADAP